MRGRAAKHRGDGRTRVFLCEGCRPKIIHDLEAMIYVLGTSQSPRNCSDCQTLVDKTWIVERPIVPLAPQPPQPALAP